MSEECAGVSEECWCEWESASVTFAFSLIHAFNSGPSLSTIRRLRMADGSEDPECLPIHSLSSCSFR